MKPFHHSGLDLTEQLHSAGALKDWSQYYSSAKIGFHVYDFDLEVSDRSIEHLHLHGFYCHQLRSIASNTLKHHCSRISSYSLSSDSPGSYCSLLPRPFD